MKKSVILLAIFSCIMISAQAQEEFFDAPDFRQIERNTKEPSSSFYYPNLMKRYMDGDAKLTLNEGRHLYFGYVFQQGYEPTDTSSYNNLLAQTLAKGVFTPADYNDILQYSSALLLQDPFNLRALNAMLLVYAQQNDTEEYKKVAQQRKVVQDAIVSTGDGMSDNTPFYVIKVAHEYDILPFLGYTYGGEDKIIRGKKVNYLTLGQNRFGVERVYFNISPVIDYVSSHGGGKM
jgi:hypothetical protein